jgi:hypothetical protein
VRLPDIAVSLNITERSAFGIITDLVEAGYVVKEKNGRRNRYHIQAHLSLPEPDGREPTVGEILAVLAGADAPPNMGSSRSSRRLCDRLSNASPKCRCGEAGASWSMNKHAG